MTEYETMVAFQKKYNRIVEIMTGMEYPSVESRLFAIKATVDDI